MSALLTGWFSSTYNSYKTHNTHNIIWNPVSQKTFSSFNKTTPSVLKIKVNTVYHRLHCIYFIQASLKLCLIFLCSSVAYYYYYSLSYCCELHCYLPRHHMWSWPGSCKTLTSHSLMNKMIDWLNNWLINWLLDWLINWLIVVCNMCTGTRWTRCDLRVGVR